MHRRIFLAGLASFCLITASGAAPAAAPPSDMYVGKIAGSGAKAITVVVKNGDNIEFMIPADCLITIDGEPSTADKLAVGLSVKIMASKNGGAHVAQHIHAASAN